MNAIKRKSNSFKDEFPSIDNKVKRIRTTVKPPFKINPGQRIPVSTRTKKPRKKAICLVEGMDITVTGPYTNAYCIIKTNEELRKEVPVLKD